MSFGKKTPGSKEKIKIYLPSGDFLSAIVINGVNPGKTLVITAGVHGCEYLSILAAKQIAKELVPEQLSGQVIIVPLVNEAGFHAGAKQIVPTDGKNLNRAFPGNIAGTKAEQIAIVIERELFPLADFLVDLHGGDIHEALTPFVFFPVETKTEVTKAAREAANALTLPYRVASTAKNGLYSWAAQCGIPALLIERGSRGVWSEAEVQDYTQNLYELLAHLKMRPYAFPKKEQIEISKTYYLEAPCNGFWYPVIKEGEHVPKGAVLGELRDIQDVLIKQWTANEAGVVLYYTQSLGVCQNDSLLAYGILEES